MFVVEVSQKLTSLYQDNIHYSSISKQETTLSNSQYEFITDDKPVELVDNTDENESTESEDDFHDLPSEFDDDDLFLDESIDDRGDMTYLRSAAKNLMSSLNEIEITDPDLNTDDGPKSLLYGDDYVIGIKSRRFALAFLDYTQFRVEKQCNSDKIRLFESLKKLTENKKCLNNVQQREKISTLMSNMETKTSKKKRNKRHRKKKNINNNDKGILLINNKFSSILLKFLEFI